jgi:hypothetical protein
MAKHTTDPKDPMSREVDRLLSQLGRFQYRDSSPAEEARTVITAGPASYPATTSSPAGITVRGTLPSAGAASTRDRIALWSRVALVATLGILMQTWPYAHACGLSLLGYTCAVVTLMIGAAWVAMASWKQRSGPAHLVALILFFWGIVLAAEQLLPRIGYGSPRATWQCTSANANR